MAFTMEYVRKPTASDYIIDTVIEMHWIVSRRRFFLIASWLITNLPLASLGQIMKILEPCCSDFEVSSFNEGAK